MDSMNGQLVTG